MDHMIVDGLLVFVERKPNKNLYLRVLPDGSVKATVPKHTGEDAIARFVREKRSWLEAQQVRVAAREAQNSVMLTEAHRTYLQTVLPPRIAHYEAVLGVHVKEWRIRNMKTRWGTCNYAVGRVWFALMLAVQPLDLIDYVVLHELVHLLEPSHNARFQNIMSTYMPDWRERRKALNGGST